MAEGTTGIEKASKVSPAVVREGDQLRAEGSRLVLMDLQGRSVRIATGVGGTVRMDLGGVPSGVNLATTRAGSLPVVLAP